MDKHKQVLEMKPFHVNQHCIPKECFAGMAEEAVESIAGPMVVSLVTLPKKHTIAELSVDINTLEDHVIQELAKKVLQEAYYTRVYCTPHSVIDALGVQQAQTHLWSHIAGVFQEDFPGHSIVVNETHSILKLENKPDTIEFCERHDSIQAASILSKACVMTMMKKYHEKLPQYEFHANKGTITPSHLECIRENGLSPIHRKTLTKQAMEQKTEKEEVELTQSEREFYVMKNLAIVEAYPNVFGELKLHFLKQYCQYLQNNHAGNKKEQYNLKKINDEIAIMIQKQNLDISHITYEKCCDNKTSQENVVSVVKEVVSFLKMEQSLLETEEIQNLNQKIKRLSGGETLQEIELLEIQAYREKVIQNIFERGII